MKRYDLVDRGVWERDLRMEEDSTGEWVKYDDVADALRWRKWPEEKPEKPGYYTVMKMTVSGKRIPDTFLYVDERDGEYWTKLGVTHWLPIPPMGEE